MTQPARISPPSAKPADSHTAAPRWRSTGPGGVSRRQLERGLAEGRRLHGEAMRAGFRAAFNLVFKRRSARGAGFGSRHQAC